MSANDSRKTPIDRNRVNHYKKVSVLTNTDYFPTISGNAGNSKVGDQDRIIGFPTLASLIYSLFFRTGEGTLTKGTHTIYFSQPFDIGSSVHLDFKSTNSIGNVTNTILISNIDNEKFIVKVDLDCDYTYTANLI